MKKAFWVGLNTAILLFAVAFAAAPSFNDLLQIPAAELFTQTAALVAALNLLGAALRHYAHLTGFPLYIAILVGGMVIGTIGQVAGLLTVTEYVAMPTPLGGIAYGLAAGLQAVGVNQGKRQAVGKSPVDTVPPSHDLPRSG